MKPLKLDPAFHLNNLLSELESLRDLIEAGETLTPNESMLLDTLAEQVTVIQRLNEHELDMAG